MTVKELIKCLKEIDPEGNREVYLSSDSEGNHYGSTSSQSFNWDTTKLIIYPWEEYIEIELDTINEDTEQYDDEIRDASEPVDETDSGVPKGG